MWSRAWIRVVRARGPIGPSRDQNRDIDRLLGLISLKKPGEPLCAARLGTREPWRHGERWPGGAVAQVHRGNAKQCGHASTHGPYGVGCPGSFSRFFGSILVDLARAGKPEKSVNLVKLD